MKIIDIFQKIANGEEAPKKIKYKDRTYTFHTNEENDYYYQDDKCKYFLFSIRCFDDLNDEVEILEEEKEIPEKLDIRQEKNIKNIWKWKVYGKEHSYNISTPQKIIAERLNQVIDYLKSKGE